MRIIRLIPTSLIVLFAIQSMAYAQSTTITETFKKHFNETVQHVHQSDNADDKRMILNDSFTKMILTLDRIESQGQLSDDEKILLNSYRNDLLDKKNELAGLDGFDPVQDEDLDEFSSYSQDFLEQANRTFTIGITTALLIVLILLLL